MNTVCRQAIGLSVRANTCKETFLKPSEAYIAGISKP